MQLVGGENRIRDEERIQPGIQIQGGIKSYLNVYARTKMTEYEDC